MQKTLPIACISKTEKLILLKKLTKDYINIEAIYSDETGNFINPPEPSFYEQINIKIRTAKHNVDSVFINYNNKQYIMERFNSNKNFDFYQITITPIDKTLKYFFSIIKDNETYFYNKKGVYKEVDNYYDFCIIPDFKTPEWSKGAVMYQIYVDRFFNGDFKNDPENDEYIYLGRVSQKINNWSEPVLADDICNFYGGDLQGVIDKMGYLKQLGIDAIYFNPIFVSPSSHKYDIQDYDYIDPHFGVIINDNNKPLNKDKFANRFASMYVQRTTDKENLEASNQLMIDLIKIAHDNNIKVILDGVFNHCGAFNKWLDKEGFYYRAGYPAGAYREEDSQYHDYFRWYEKNWPNNDCYDSWWGHDNHPKLHFEGSKDLYDYILDVGAKWVKEPYNADGWRLDVAADLGNTKEFNHKFWIDFRNAVKTANPNAIILAEHYGDPKDWISGQQWDTVMNYDAFMEPLTWFLTGMEKHSEEFKQDMYNNAMAFENSMRYYMARFTYQSLYTSMNQLSNHDHSRFLTRTNKTVGRLHTVGSHMADTGINLSIMMEAVTFQMTWPGAPTVYYGDEAGMTGWTDPDNRRTYPWGKENNMLVDFHKKAIDIRKNSKALLKGSAQFIFSNYGVLCFGRWYKEESVIVILNNNNTEQNLTLPVWRANIDQDCVLYQKLATLKDSFYSNGEQFYVKDGQLFINVPPFSSIVLSNVES